MAKYCVNEQGVLALSNMTKALRESVESITKLCVNARDLSDVYSNTLGPHKKSLDVALENIIIDINDAIEPLSVVQESLEEVVESYQEIIGNNRIKNIENKQEMPAKTKLGRIFGNKESKKSSFGTFDVGTYENGALVIKGGNFDKYLSEYYDPDSYEIQDLGSQSYVNWIPSGAIEGIHLNEYEFENEEKFWDDGKNGTKESFKEIASFIPSVKQQISGGKTLSEIKGNDKLEACAALYFDPSNMPTVIFCEGYYEFVGNGRHRILAARELGYDIPVKVIGKRVRK